MRIVSINVIVILFLASCGTPENKQTVDEKTSVVYENKPSLVIPGADGSLELNAENGAGIGPDIKYMPEWRAFGWFRNKDIVEWDVLVKETGNYTASMEWSVSDEESGKAYLLEAATGSIAGIVGKSGSWETFKAETIGQLPLEAGQQKIRFKPAKDFDSTGALMDLRFIKLELAK